MNNRIDEVLRDNGVFTSSIAPFKNEVFDAMKEYGQEQSLKFFAWVFNECSTDSGHFPHELGFWHKEKQKYLTAIELYELFVNTNCAVAGN